MTVKIFFYHYHDYKSTYTHVGSVVLSSSFRYTMGNEKAPRAPGLWYQRPVTSGRGRDRGWGWGELGLWSRGAGAARFGWIR